jgi:hypothetical protein
VPVTDARQSHKTKRRAAFPAGAPFVTVIVGYNTVT